MRVVAGAITLWGRDNLEEGSIGRVRLSRTIILPSPLDNVSRAGEYATAQRVRHNVFHSAAPAVPKWSQAPRRDVPTSGRTCFGDKLSLEHRARSAAFMARGPRVDQACAGGQMK
jgi:hypothetical protein